MARPKDPQLPARILAAAAREFSASGYAGASMDAIGAAAGVTKGGVYLHFRGKEELFFAVLDQWREAIRAVLAAGGEAPTLRGFLVDYLTFQFRHPEATGLLRVLGTELRGRFTTKLREDLRATQRAVRGRIRDLLTMEVHRGSLFAADPAMATFVLASSVEGVVALWHSAPADSEPFCRPETLAEYLIAPYEFGPAVPGVGSEAPGVIDGVDFLPPLSSVTPQ